jgi:hypothetical protein
MRLGQLARQLTVKTDDIVNFLGKHNISLDNGNNTRIDDVHVEMILQHFAPGNESIKQQIIQEPEVTEPELEAQTVAEESVAAPSTETEIPELIKAPKIELPGLRVLGKIELPEKKKPEPEKEPAPEQEPRQNIPPRRPARNYPTRTQKNPITQAREREDRERREKLDEQREKEKQRRTEFYKKRLKPQPPTKAVRLHREEFAEMPGQEEERPKTWWGRFKRWLNT